MKKTNGLPNALALLMASLLTAGCMSGTKPAQFYTLNPIPEAPRSSSAASNKLALAVGPVRLPEAIRRPQIVSRIGDNRLDVSEFHRWAGGLEQEITRVVAENLGLLMGTNQVAGYPWEAGFKPDFRVSLDIRRLDGRLGKDAVLHAGWAVWSAATGQTVLASGKTTRTEPVDQGDYDALVAAYSRLLEAMSREIAEAIPRH
jgi:uncharacterized lipoprotein YmbA